MSQNGTARTRLVYEYLNLVDGKTYRKYRQDIPGDKIIKSDPKFHAEEMALYNYDLLPEHRRTRPDKPVFLCEGEETAKAYVACGATAVCTAGSASQRRFGRAFEALRGLKVVQVPDYDKTGVDFMDATLTALSKEAVDVRRGNIEPFLPAQEEGESDEDYAKRIKGWDWADVMKALGWDVQAGRDLLSTIVLDAAPTEAPPEDEVRDWLAGGGVDGPTVIPFVALKDLLATPDKPINWLADGLISAPNLFALVGPYKGGKSTLYRILIACAATGTSFLGRGTRKVVCGYASLEERQDDVKPHFRTLFLDGVTPELAFSACGSEWLPNKLNDRYESVYRTIQEFGLELLVVGPIQDLLGLANANDYSEVRTKLMPLKRIADETGCAIGFDHHFNKYGVGRNALLGSVAFGAVCDQVFYLPYDKDKNIRAFFSDQRVGVSINEPLGIEYGAQGIESWLGPPQGELRDMLKEAQDMERILEFCAEQARTTDDVETSLRIRRDDVLRLLKKGVAEKRVSVDGRGVKGDPRTYLTVSAPPPAQEEQ